MFSCKYYCPDFDINDKSIISYRNGDSITYISNLNDTIKLEVIDFYAESDNYFRGFLIMDYVCAPPGAYYLTSTDKVVNIFFQEQVVGYDLKVSFGDDALFNLPFFDNGREKPNGMSLVFIEEISINEDLYQNAWLVADLSKRRRIDQFVKATSYGIIKFHDKTTDLTWTLLRKN
jgi:hypothetical protein